MRAWRMAVGIPCCLIVAAGCGECLNPYLSCGPVWSEGIAQNCNPNYRAGSILNRPATAVEAASQTPAPTTVGHTANATVEIPPVAVARPIRDDAPPPPVHISSQPNEPGSHATVAAIAKKRQVPRATATNDPLAPPPPLLAAVPEGPTPRHRLRTVDAPPSAKEGETRILSVTDRRQDEAERDWNSVAAKGKTVGRAQDRPSEESAGWRPAATAQDPAESANRPLKTDQ